MKALEKDRSRRYETANGLAMDLRRHLEHEPVLAGPPSAAYKLSKFVRRNRVTVAAGSVVALSLIAAAVVSVGFALSEADQRRIAGAEATRADEEARKAIAEKEIAQAVNEFLNEDLLAAVAPSAEKGKGRDVLMRDVLDEAAKRIEEASRAGGRFEDKPLVEASIRLTLGITYRKLGEYPAAQPHLEQARLLRRRELGDEHPDTLTSMKDLAYLYLEQGLYDEAEPLMLKTLEITKRVLGAEHLDTLGSMKNLAELYAKQGRMNDARPLVGRLLDLRRERAERPGASAGEKNAFAWELLTCEPADLRDAQTALALAIEANEMTEHKNPYCLDTLSLAYHLTGDTAKAIENQKKAISLLPADADRSEHAAALARFEAALPTEQEAVASDKPGQSSSDGEDDE